jgi:hypothetical protein
MAKIVLSKPLDWEGTARSELDLDLGSLTGQDVTRAEREAKALGDTEMVREFSKTYLACVAGRACKLPADAILALGIKDFTAVTLTVQNFLLDAVSPPAQ